MAKVDVIKAQVSVTDRRRRSKSIERKRVAAYCRVSTDSEDQLNSYRSQVQYYTDKISENVDWMMAGIYADEGITGTQVAKRDGFQKMINDCMSGQIDMVITKSISRFARNTLDTLKYVRMLKEKDIAVFFEDENINTLSMDGELLLVVLSSVAQQEVENISSNVKKGLAMKMSRGEIVGFAGALGYDYNPETKQITVNEEEAKIAREAFKHSWVCAFNRCNDSCPKKKSEKKSDFDNKQEIKQKLYEISDLNEVLRSFLRAANNSDTDAGITVTGCIRNEIEAALNMVEV